MSSYKTSIEMDESALFDQIDIESFVRYHGKNTILHHIDNTDLLSYIGIEECKKYWELYEEDELREKYFKDDLEEVLDESKS